jgi:hypothetical protein
MLQWKSGVKTMDRQICLQFLGSGDNFGSGGRFQTCIYVDSGNDRFLIDIVETAEDGKNITV